MAMSDRARVLIVGLDGATFDVIRPLAAQGRLPALQRLMDEGAWGVLRSTVPPISPTAWTTFATGKNPGKHGVFDFRHLGRDYKLVARPMQQHGHKTIWRLLSERKRRVIAIDVPFTYPPEAVNGLMVSGYPTPRAPGTVYTHPPDLPQHLQEAGFDLALGWPEARIDVHPDFFRAWEEVMDERERLLEHLMVHEEWDLFMVVFGITDTLSHSLWNFLEPSHPAYYDSQAAEYREALFQAYDQADRVLSRLWSLVDERTHLLVLSDHGFGSVRPRQWLFRFLAEHGWLRFQGGKGARRVLGSLRRAALGAYTEVGWIRRRVRELRPQAKGRLRQALAQGGLLAESRNVDVEASPTIPSDFGTHIYLNRRNRFSKGFLSDPEARELAGEIRQALLAERDPSDGGPIVQDVHTREAVYSGGAVIEAPDLIVEYANRYAPREERKPSNPGLEGGHVAEGILLAWGPGIRPGQLPETDLVHLAPTALYLTGEAVPPDMDGHVLENLLKPEWLARRPVRAADRTAFAAPQESAYTADEMAEVEAQLQALGYVG